MKHLAKYIIGSLLICMFLYGCAKSSITYANKYIFGQDQQYTYNTNFSSCVMAESSDGYYFMSGETCEYLYYRDKENKINAPVCSKPECQHDNYTTCNAYLGHIMDLKYYSEKIYYLIDGAFNFSGSHKNALCEASLDGGEHKELLTFSEAIYRMALHRGYLYYVTTDYGTITGKEESTQTTMRLYRLPIERLKAKPEFLYEFKGIYANVGPLLCYGNYLYYPHYYCTDASLDQYSSQMDRYNILDGTMETILTGCTTRYTFFNGGLAVTYPDGTYLCDLDGQNLQKVWDREGDLLPGSEYLLVDTIGNLGVMTGELTRVIAVIDQDGDLLGSAKLDRSYYTPVGVIDETYLVFKNDSDTGNQTIYQIPLEKVAEGKAEPEVFFEYTSKAHGQ